MSKYTTLLGLLLLFSTCGTAEVVINEIHYDPVDAGLEAGSFREFLEFFNPGPDAVDLSGYELSQGVRFTFPPGTLLTAFGYLVVARDPTHHRWAGVSFPVLGPYDGRLSNGGDRIQFIRSDRSVVEDFLYDDELPWPTGADGYGPSLERIAPDLPAGDPHSWRASLLSDGTPGRQNSVVGTNPRPSIAGSKVEPSHPNSTDTVSVQFGFDSPELILSATLRWESISAPRRKSTNPSEDLQTTQPKSVNATPMSRVAENPGVATYEATLPPMPSQTLVRLSASLTLSNGSSTTLPHAAERRPFESYFVYDGEIDSLLPVLWEFAPWGTFSAGVFHSSAVILPVSGTIPLVFDCASIARSRNGEKIRFIKGEEFRGDRTLNLIPERPRRGTTAGISSPHREHLAFQLFRDMGVLSPRADWFRVISNPLQGSASQTQRLGIQQVNEAFLEMNGRSSEGSLFKRTYTYPLWENHMNKEEGTAAIDALEQAISVADPNLRRLAFETHLNLIEFQRYSIASILLTNWDGFHNNHWMYRGPEPEDRWEIIPWDQDKSWGYTDSNPQFTELPHTFPVDGFSWAVSRQPGPITGPLHQDEAFYKEYLTRLRLELDGYFAESRLFDRIDTVQTLLLNDLQLLEQHIEIPQDQRREQILDSYEIIRKYIQLRRAYLDSTLPPISPEVLAPVPDSATFVARDRILLSFDRGLEPTSAQTPANYQLDCGVGSPSSASLENEVAGLCRTSLFRSYVQPHRLGRERRNL